MAAIVDPQVEAYAQTHSSPEDPQLAALAEATRAQLTMPQMLSGPVAARLLEFLVFMLAPQLVLELGTYSGYSALWLAAALPAEGRVITCELDSQRAAFARERFAASPHGERIELREGPALETIAALDGPFDLVFIDADKPGYISYYDAVVPKLAPRGVIVADNTLYGGEVLAPDRPGSGPNAASMARFNEHVLADPRTICVQLTVRDGVTLIRRAA